MKARLSVDPLLCECGPATPAVRELLAEFSAIDWFEPVPVKAAAIAQRWFEQHHRLAGLYQPELFPAQLDVDVVWGGWPEFSQLHERAVEIRGWDWKFSALKLLSRRHSQEHGWALQDLPVEVASELPAPDRLFLRMPGAGEFLIWSVWSELEVPPETLTPTAAASAGWYLGYANMDLIEAIEWQLAESSDQLEGNPYVPLLRCYLAGLYPFGFGPSEFVLFGFDPASESSDSR